MFIPAIRPRSRSTSSSLFVGGRSRRPLQALVGGDVDEEVVDAGDADPGEHRGAVGFGMRKIAHPMLLDHRPRVDAKALTVIPAEGGDPVTDVDERREPAVFAGSPSPRPSGSAGDDSLWVWCKRRISSGRLDPDFGLHRIGDEAIVVGGVVEPVEIRPRRASCRRRRRSSAAASRARSRSAPRRSSPSPPRRSSS